MKRFSNKLFLGLAIFTITVSYLSSCTHDTAFLPPAAPTTPTITRGTAIMLPGNMTTGNTTEWKFDKSHSSILWTTNYVGASGLLTGRFNQFGIHNVTPALMTSYVTTGQPLKDSSWAFYENEPTKTYFHGYVQINQSNTGEPGRDANCNLSGMGTTAIVAGTQNLSVTNLAKIETTKIEFDPLSTDYIVTLNLTWQGKLAAPFTKSIVGRMKYIKKATVQFGTGAAYDVFGLQLKFQFNCRDFGMTSTSISDNILVECNTNFHNK